MISRQVIVYTVLSLFLLSSCSSYKKVPYLQSSGGISVVQSNYPGSVVRFQSDDVLGITVNATGEPVVASDFNLPLQPSATMENSDEWNVSQGYGRQTYRVDTDGKIDFPILGRIQVSGLSQEELESKLKQSLRKYLKADPIVTIRLMNYRVSVLGEVNRPGQYSVSSNRINVFEALSLAGDMSIYGRRDNVRLVRTLPGGETHIQELDISRADIVESPYFYLHQNDVLYVEPNKARAKSSDIGSQTSILISLGSMVLTLVNLIVLIAK